MMQLIQRHSLQSEKSNRFGQQPLHVQTGGGNHAAMSKELLDLTVELKQLRGEELQGLGMNELMKLEKLVETGLSRVGKTKNDKLMNELSKLKSRELELMEENALLKQQAEMQRSGCTRNAVEQGNSAESISNSQGLGHYPEEDRSISDTSLKLGLPFSSGE